MAMQTKATQRTYQPGDKVPYPGEYCIVDKAGNKQDVGLVNLEEGDTFPEIQVPKAEKLCYTLNETYLEEKEEEVDER